MRRWNHCNRHAHSPSLGLTTAAADPISVGDASGLDGLHDADYWTQIGLTELVVGLEVLQSLVKISIWIAFQPTGLLAWLYSRFGMGTTWLWSVVGRKKGFAWVC